MTKKHHVQAMTSLRSRRTTGLRLTLLLLLAAVSAMRVAGANPQFNCVVLPDAVVDVSSGTDGRIDFIGVDRGDVVAPGQVLASLESGVEQANVALARAKAQIDTEIRLREARLGFDRRRKDRIQSLYQKAATSPQERDDADSEAVLSQWLLKQAEDNKRLAQLELERAEELLALRTVRSPIGGVVVERYKWPGEFVEDEPILGVARLDPLRVEVIVPVEKYGQIIRRMQAEVLTETAPSERRLATVTMVDPMADPASGTFRVALELPNPDYKLLGGIKCMAEFLPESRVAAAEAAHVSSPTPVSGPSPTVISTRKLASTDVRLPTVTPADASCASLGPVRDMATAEALARAMTKAGAAVSTRHVPGEVDLGYIVLATPESDDEVWTLEELLVSAGVSDLLVMSRGAYAGSVALGTYTRESAAQRRRDALVAQGFDVRVRARTRDARAWWLDVTLPQDSVARTRVERIADASSGDLGPCPSVLTAGSAEPR